MVCICKIGFFIFCYCRFHSNEAYNSYGFQLLYNSSNFFTSCGGSYTNVNGTLTSPLYLNNYPSMAKCLYVVHMPNGSYVNLSIIAMHIDCQETGYTSDYIEIRDGNSDDSPLMGRFCGNGSNIPASMQTTQNYLRIRFVTHL